MLLTFKLMCVYQVHEINLKMDKIMLGGSPSGGGARGGAAVDHVHYATIQMTNINCTTIQVCSYEL